MCVFFLMIRRPPRSTLFPYTDALPICDAPEPDAVPRGRVGRPRRGHLGGARAAPPLHPLEGDGLGGRRPDRKSTRLNSSHPNISYAVFCLKKKNNIIARV